MSCLFSELRSKEVIDLKSGLRLGYVCDAEFDACSGQICALIVPGAGRAGEGPEGIRNGVDLLQLPGPGPDPALRQGRRRGLHLAA